MEHRKLKVVVRMKSGDSWNESWTIDRRGMPFDQMDPKDQVIAAREVIEDWNSSENTRNEFNPKYVPQFRELVEVIGLEDLSTAVVEEDDED